MRPSTASRKTSKWVAGLAGVLLFFGIFSFHLGVSSSLWRLGYPADLYYFWSASCAIENFPDRVGCDTINETNRTIGYALLKTYPFWSHIFFYIPRHFSFTEFLYGFEIFSLVSLAFSGALLYQIFRYQQKPCHLTVLLSLCLLTFFPLFLLFRLGQPTAFQLLALSAAIFFFEREKILFSSNKQISGLFFGFFLALTLVKPHSLYLVYTVLFIDAFCLGRWLPLSGLLSGFLALIAVSFPYSPSPSLLHYIDLIDHLLYFSQPIAGDFFGSSRIFFRIGFVILASILAFSCLRGMSRDFRCFSIVLPLSLLTAPYGFAYDQVLLLPSIFLIVVSEFLSEREKCIFVALFSLPMLFSAFGGGQSSSILYPLIALFYGLCILIRQGKDLTLSDNIELIAGTDNSITKSC